MSMKKIKISLLIVIALLIAVLGVYSATHNKKKSSDNKKATFTVGFDQNFPPFGYKDKNGEFKGFDIDLARECAKRMGKKLVLKPIDWDSKDIELETGNIDCIWNGFTIDGRENSYAWTKAYMDNSQVFVVKKDSNIKNSKDLAGKVVDVQMDSSAETALKSDDHKELLKSFSKMQTVGDYNTAMMDLDSGAVDAVAMDVFVAKDQIKGKEDKFVILEDKISSEKYGVGFAKNNTKLRDLVEKTLFEMKDDNTFARISKKWFKTDVCILEK
ncbi:amino acid ABC transporter substrate-binding protein [Lachnobacterium bovis]|uniref:Polar amino acid transport system substrate-binding protein n=1 Tax=Lachnobacterium bovis DSM 14045 TaxID=1122142 RepID=A0A1H3KBW0_9FIRM|nr:amino acid ABC transporter substrate-binding protein [Lachnobacterium bovis]SDY49656.1 polar amino acid transport system substrate-binding protein [Lachnobacterium bovis DSM 14045]